MTRIPEQSIHRPRQELGVASLYKAAGAAKLPGRKVMADQQSSKNDIATLKVARGKNLRCFFVSEAINLVNKAASIKRLMQFTEPFSFVSG